HSEIVHGMIIGNLVSTPLLLGAGTLIGCYKNTTLKFDEIMENESEDKSSDGSDVSIDIYDETECLKITKYFKLNILLQLFILVIASVIVFLVSNVMESLVEDLPLSENFLSIIVLGFIGSVPEHATSIN
ncbi:14763_t:CDS:2, partial [Gigaspora margarita]